MYSISSKQQPLCWRDMALIYVLLLVAVRNLWLNCCYGVIQSWYGKYVCTSIILTLGCCRSASKEYTYDIAWWLWKFIYILVYENVYFCTMLSDYSYIFALWPVYLWSAKRTYFSDSSYYYEEWHFKLLDQNFLTEIGSLHVSYVRDFYL